MVLLAVRKRVASGLFRVVKSRGQVLMFVVAVEFVIEEAHVDDFRQQAMLQSQNSLKLEEACRVFDVCCDPECPTDWFFYEVYDDRSAFERHRETKHFANYTAAVTPWIVSKDIRFLERVT